MDILYGAFGEGRFCLLGDKAARESVSRTGFSDNISETTGSGSLELEAAVQAHVICEQHGPWKKAY